MTYFKNLNKNRFKFLLFTNIFAEDLPINVMKDMCQKPIKLGILLKSGHRKRRYIAHGAQ